MNELSLLPSIGILLLAFVSMAVGANFMIDSSAAIARRFGISTLLIGLTILAFGTSIPEIMIALSAAFTGNVNLSTGNAIGSNIANIGLILGITGLYKPLWVRSRVLKNELPLLFIVMGLVGIMIIKERLDASDGYLLLFGALVVIAWFIWQGKKTKASTEELTTEVQNELRTREVSSSTSLFKTSYQLIIGILLLPISAYLIVKAGTNIAHIAKVSNLTIGLTIIAIGSSLPELTTSLVGAKKGEDDLIIGNIIGSNIFNLLAVLAIPVILSHSITLTAQVLYRDYLAMILTSVLLYYFAFASVKGRRKLTRPESAVLFLLYTAYLIIIRLMA